MITENLMEGLLLDADDRLVVRSVKRSVQSLNFRTASRGTEQWHEGR